MTPQTIKKQAAEEGITLTLTDAGTIRANGPRETLARWVPTIEEHKPELIETLSQEAEYRRRLTWIADHLDADLGDLIDFYRDDVETICQMDGRDLLDIVREYLNLKFYYRSIHPAATATNNNEDE